MAQKRNNNIVAADFGYGMTKSYNGNKYIGLLSLVGDAIKLKFNTNIMSKDKKNIHNLTRISVRINDKSMFLGELALKQSNLLYHVLDKEKIFYETTSYLMKTSLALVVNDGATIDIVTGLPVAHYDKTKQEQLESILLGKHIIDFDWDLDGSYKYRVTFTVNKVKVIPQPVGTYFDFLLNKQGEFLRENINLANNNIGIIDIGYGTSDFCVIKDMEYIEKSSGSLNKATGTVYEVLANKFLNHTGVSVDPYLLGLHAIRSGEYNVNNTTYNLKKLLDSSLASVFEEILVNIKAAWRNEYAIDTYIIAGGGGLLMKDLFINAFGDKGRVLISKSPVFSNVTGYWKYGNKIFA